MIRVDGQSSCSAMGEGVLLGVFCFIFRSGGSQREGTQCTCRAVYVCVLYCDDMMLDAGLAELLYDTCCN